MKNLKYLILSFVIIVLDQVSKIYVRFFFENKTHFHSIPVIGDFFRITHTQNPGAAFSFTLGSPFLNRIIFSVISFVVIGILVWLIIKSEHKLQTVSFSLIIAGAVGNLIDRIYLGSVTDFLDFDFPDFLMERWPIFNVADSAICVAIGLYIIYILFYEKKINKENPIVEDE